MGMMARERSKKASFGTIKIFSFSTRCFFFIISRLIVIDIKFNNNKKRVPTNLVIKVKLRDLCL